MFDSTVGTAHQLNWIGSSIVLARQIGLVQQLDWLINLGCGLS